MLIIITTDYPELLSLFESFKQEHQEVIFFCETIITKVLTKCINHLLHLLLVGSC